MRTKRLVGAGVLFSGPGWSYETCVVEAFSREGITHLHVQRITPPDQREMKPTVKNERREANE